MDRLRIRGWSQGPGPTPFLLRKSSFLVCFCCIWSLLLLGVGNLEEHLAPVPYYTPAPHPPSLQVLQFPQLRQLSLSLLPALTDNGLVAVARGCPSLERLALSHCSLLSDEGWAQAASSWPRLQHLNLSSCSRLTEQ